MSNHNKQARRAAQLMAETGSASLSVVASRLLAMSDPKDFLSRRQQRETSKMVSEKLQAGFDGWVSASIEMAAMPGRLLQATARPSRLLTPAGCMDAWMTLGGLWLGVGNAALLPARKAVVANRARLGHGGAPRRGR